MRWCWTSAVGRVRSIVRSGSSTPSRSRRAGTTGPSAVQRFRAANGVVLERDVGSARFLRREPGPLPTSSSTSLSAHIRSRTCAIRSGSARSSCGLRRRGTSKCRRGSSNRRWGSNGRTGRAVAPPMAHRHHRRRGIQFIPEISPHPLPLALQPSERVPAGSRPSDASVQWLRWNSEFRFSEVTIHGLANQERELSALPSRLTRGLPGGCGPATRGVRPCRFRSAA